MTIKIFSSPKNIEQTNENQKWTQVIVVTTATIPMIISGALQSWPSPSIPKLMSNESHIPMTFEEASYFAVIHPIAIIILCPFCGFLLNTLGRKWFMVLVFVPQFASWLLVGFSVNSIMLHAARVFVGFGDAIIFIALPVYIAEITEKRLRGPLGCVLMISFFLGQIIMNTIGYYLSIRTAAFIMSSFSIIHLLLFVWMPESPYWLIEKNRLEQAKRELQILRWRSNVDEEFYEIEQAVKRQMSEKSSYKDIFVSKSNRRAFLIASVVRLAQQFSGINAFMTYLQYIFQEAGGDVPSHVSSIISMALTAVGALIASRFIDKFGRKPLLMISCYGSIITLLSQAVYFYISDIIDTSVVSWLPLAIMLAYIMLFSVGFCIIPTLLLGELFSASIKSKAVILVMVIFACAMMSSAKIFQVLADNVGLYAPFLFFALSTIFFTIVVSFIFIETKNKTLEEIQQELKRSTS
ncbi:facilitated trehalose transporter Tret1-like isoform X2 [Agrilus planipennis]|uniref:Facilitated trehalose transporter Tret1-like isoform X1 n=1 Tax=Agrilus planipennis TaxID=224129 RepID=A0A1W4WND5_AGRPL|nr:facilitated trehalose transporter Tret1-like isoform X1 [Agrilus planipennis]XP_025836957.1 facilitated trehalose transporter Tret1-like isoform X2 [Agrilus planipennis]